MLTIAIPTYNRHRLLRNQIERLLPQLEDRVKILILDNKSEPALCETIGDLVTSKVTIVRNVINIGGDANICRCFEYCDTEWLWVLSDDDMVKRDAVSIIITSIKNNSESVFINFKSETDYTTNSLEDLCNKKPNYSNSFFISACIYNNLKLKPYLFYYYSNLSSMHGQLILVLKYLELNGGGKCSFITSNYLESEGQADWPKSLYIERVPLLLSCFKGENRDLIRKAFGNSIAFHMLYFINILRIFESMTCSAQLINIIRVVWLVRFDVLVEKNIAKILILNMISFASKKLAHKLMTNRNLVTYQVRETI